MADTYDPGRIKMDWNNIPIRDFAEDTYVEVEFMTEAFTSVAGADGGVTRVRSRDGRATIKFTLRGGGVTNDRLSAMHNQDKAFGTGKGGFNCRDLNGTTVATATEAWITKLSPWKGAKGATEREWVLECADLQMFVGGNV